MPEGIYVAENSTSIFAPAPDPLTQGWFNHGDKLLELAELHKPKVCVELGTWLGASAIPIARSIRRWGGTLTCVDTWAGTVDGESLYRAPWMLASCARNIIEGGVQANVRLIPATTLDAARYWTQPIDWLYVDADHTYESVRDDLVAWVSKVKPGGLILGDDYGSDMYPGVKQAWDEFERTYDFSFTRHQSVVPDKHGIQLIYGTV